MYKHPGVYIEHVPSGALAIEAASASTAVFVGHVPRGKLGEPVFITGVAGYAAAFGDPGGGAVRDLDQQADVFGHAVTAFFDNGGSKAYVVPVGAGGAPAVAALSDPSAGAAQGLYLTARSPGEWGNRLAARLTPVDPGGDASLGYVLDIGTIVMKGGARTLAPLESFRPVSMDPNDGRFVEAVVNRESALVELDRKPVSGAGAGGQISAVRSGSLRNLNLSDLKGQTLKLTLNGTAVEVKFGDPLATVETTRGSDTETASAAAPAASLEDLVGLLEESVLLHEDHAGFRAYLDEEKRLVLVPPSAAGGAAAVTVPNSAGSTARPTLLFGSPEALDHPTGGIASFFGGADTTAPTSTEYKAAFQTLRDYRDAAIILLPGRPWADGNKEIVQAAIAHAEFMQNAMVIVDPPDMAIETPKQVSDLGFEQSPYAALYHPWLEVTNNHYNPDTASNRPRTFRMPPSASVAGLWARTDARRGIWKAPAGLEAGVRGTRGPTRLIGNDIQDNLNELGVNLIRAITGPPVVWGARTLATRSKPEFRYISVRRTQNMIGESLYRALQAVVFEPNNDFLWASLRASVGNFMDGLWRAGAFQGAKASDAYYVRCGLGSTMTQGDIDGGIVRVVVGFAPLKPAEFVVVQIQQIVGQTG